MRFLPGALALTLLVSGACADDTPRPGASSRDHTPVQAGPVPRDTTPVAAASASADSVTALGSTRLQEPPIPEGLLEEERNTIEVFRSVSPAVVYITSKEQRQNMFTLDIMEIPVGSGSGFVWDRQGHIVTNFHVVQAVHAGTTLTVTLADGSVHDAEVVGAEPNKDLAVLRIASPTAALVPVQPGNSSQLVVGQKVLAIGNPFGLDQTLTTGIISALGREIKSVTGTTIHDVIQTDASINPGNSGGPLLDSSGRLIGVNTAIYSQVGQSAGIGFAVPVNTVRQIVPQLIEFGGIKRAGLGVVLVPENRARAWRIRGVALWEVQEGSAAAKAGLQSARQDRAGRIYLDIITAIDGTAIEDYSDMYDVLERREPGDRVSVRYVRDGREITTNVVLQEIGP